jgi:hypothetical protein
MFDMSNRLDALVLSVPKWHRWPEQTLHDQLASAEVTAQILLRLIL